MKNLYIIGNEKISKYKNTFYSANIDFKSIVEGLGNLFDLILIARKTAKKENFLVKHDKIFLTGNIFAYLFIIIKSIKNIKNKRYLIISITPYTFLAYLILIFFTKNIYLYLRSDGFKEYESILGKKWVFIYAIMYSIMLSKSKIIVCNNQLSKKRDFFLVNPSELKKNWLNNRKFIIPKKIIKILYVGRVRIEKGIVDFIDIFKKLDKRFQLTIVGDRNDKKFIHNNINFINFFSKVSDLINQYDKSHIFILPSYTESHPKVVLESLARLRPVLIFEDIKHIAGNTKGIFVCKRNKKDFLAKVDYIVKNYQNIQKQIKKNRLPQKKDFIHSLYNILK